MISTSARFFENEHNAPQCASLLTGLEARLSSDSPHFHHKEEEAQNSASSSLWWKSGIELCTFAHNGNVL